MASTITKTTEQKLYILKHAACDCVHMAEIKWAVDHGNAKQLKVAVDIQYDKYIREIGPNEFECVGPLDRRCGEKFTFDVGDTEPKSTKSRHKRTAKKQAKKLRKQKSRSRSQPKRVPVPVTEQPIPSTHFILPESRTLPLDVDPLEGVSPEILKLAKTAARSNDFRYTVGLHSYRTMEDWLKSVGRYDIDLKELAVCRHRILSGENCSREQINKTLRRGVWRDWNAECLEQTFSELIPKPSAPAGEQYSDLMKLLTAQEACDLIEKETGRQYPPDYMRKLHERGHIIKHPKPLRDSYYLFSVLEYIKSRP